MLFVRPPNVLLLICAPPRRATKLSRFSWSVTDQPRRDRPTDGGLPAPVKLVRPELRNEKITPEHKQYHEHGNAPSKSDGKRMLFCPRNWYRSASAGVSAKKA